MSMLYALKCAYDLGIELIFIMVGIDIPKRFSKGDFLEKRPSEYKPSADCKPTKNAYRPLKAQGLYSGFYGILF